MDCLLAGTRSRYRIWQQQCIYRCKFRLDTAIWKILWHKRQNIRIDRKRNCILHLQVALSVKRFYEFKLYRHYLSYILNFQTYSQKYHCRTRERHFSCLWNMHRHQRNCSGKTRQFPGGMYTSPKTIFEKLEEYDVHVLPDDRLFPWFIVDP